MADVIRIDRAKLAAVLSANVTIASRFVFFFCEEVVSLVSGALQILEVSLLFAVCSPGSGAAASDRPNSGSSRPSQIELGAECEPR